MRGRRCHCGDFHQQSSTPLMMMMIDVDLLLTRLEGERLMTQQRGSQQPIKDLSCPSVILRRTLSCFKVRNRVHVNSRRHRSRSLLFARQPLSFTINPPTWLPDSLYEAALAGFLFIPRAAPPLAPSVSQSDSNAPSPQTRNLSPRPNPKPLAPIKTNFRTSARKPPRPPRSLARPDRPLTKVPQSKM